MAATSTCSKQIDRKTPIRHLPPSVFRHVTELLDVHSTWRKLAVLIKRRDGKQLKFDVLRMQTFERAASPTQCVLDAWSNDNACVGQLIDHLTEAKLYYTANYLAVDILKGSAVPGSRDEPTTPKIEIFQQVVPPSDDYAGISQTPCKQPVESSTDTTLNEKQQTTVPNNSIMEDLVKAYEQQKLLDKYVEGDTEPTQDGTCELEEFSFDDLSAVTDNFNPKPVSHGGNLLGSGGFGEVFLGLHKKRALAVKKLKEGVVSAETTEQFYTEIKVLSQFHHENLLPLVGYSVQGPLICVIYPYMHNGSLEDRLARQDDTPSLPAGLRVKIAKEVARGINHLHTGADNVIIHRDIKSANVLLDNHFTAKVGDCGLAHHGPSNDKTHTVPLQVIGTNAYMAPEYLNMEVSVKLDCYSYGVVLLELLTGLPAFDMDREDRDLPTHMTENCVDILEMIDKSAGEWPESSIQDIYRTSQQCLEMKKRRPKMSEILSAINRWPES